jgi:hypothetical protein
LNHIAFLLPVFTSLQQETASRPSNLTIPIPFCGSPAFPDTPPAIGGATLNTIIECFPSFVFPGEMMEMHKKGRCSFSATTKQRPYVFHAPAS